MSGIEAIFGVVTGGAGLLSLGIQLGDSAVKLKRLYHAVKDAPRRVERLVFSLETMAMALSELEQHRQQDRHDGVLLTRCIAECQYGAAEVQNLVNKMERHISDHGKIAGRVYTAFKERDIKDILDDLERAKSSLELAYSIYLAAEQRRRDQLHDQILAQHGNILSNLRSEMSAENRVISQQLSLLIPSSTQSQESQMIVSSTCTISRSETTSGNVDEIRSIDAHTPDSVEERDYRLSKKQIRRRKSNTCFRFRFQLPTWVCARVWDIALTQAHSRRSMHIRTFNVVPRTSPIFKYCRTGDVPAIQRLIDNGQGTLWDVCSDQNWITPIEEAAQFGQLEVCRFLLTQMTWPYEMEILHKALNRVSFDTTANRVQKQEEMYRLFLGNPGFDADLDDAMNEAWPTFHGSPQCFDIILNAQFLGFFSLPIDMRFELIDQWVPNYPIEVAFFLKYIGLRQTDPRLASLRSTDGRSVLHCIARQLSLRVSIQGNFRRWFQEWFELGICVLRNGADPCISPYISASESWPPLTPLMQCIHALHYWTPTQTVTILQVIRTWVDMIQQSGLDLVDYGIRESLVWGERSDVVEFWYFPSQTLVHLLYGPTPEDWSVKFCQTQAFPIYKLCPPPGAFPEESKLPDEIIWRPRKVDKNEGYWKKIREGRLVSAAMDLRDVADDSSDFYDHFVQNTQDDSGIVMLLEHRARHRQRWRPRSHSQPPHLRRTGSVYGKAKTCDERPWLRSFHLCPFDSRWKLTFGPHLPSDVDCAEGICDGPAEYESYEWDTGSFLYGIESCRADDRSEWQRRLSEDTGHTFGEDCPWGCIKVNVNRLHELWKPT